MVLATASEGIRLFANRGNRTFFEITQSENAFSGDDPVSDMSLIDLDRDLDLDVVTVHRSSGKVGMLEFPTSFHIYAFWLGQAEVFDFHCCCSPVSTIPSTRACCDGPDTQNTWGFQQFWCSCRPYKAINVGTPNGCAWLCLEY